MIGKPAGEHEIREPNKYQRVLEKWLDTCFDANKGCKNCEHIDLCYEMFAEFYGWSLKRWKKAKVDKGEVIREVRIFLEDFKKRKSIDTQ